MSNPIMDIAWRDFIVWAFDRPEMIAAFNADTGRSFRKPATSPLDVLIDEATGKTNDDARAFVLWATEHHWGIEDAPDAVRAEMVAKVRDAASAPPVNAPHEEGAFLRWLNENPPRGEAER